MLKMDYYGSTITGRRKENQDRFLIYNPNEQTAFLAVADGMGGMVGGGVASQLVIEIVEKEMKDVCDKLDDKRDLKVILEELFSKAQNVIRERIILEPNLTGMGTTLCCILIFNNKYVWGNLGDSRIYHFTGDKFSRITIDHSKIEEYILLENKQLDKEVVKNFGHLLTRSVNGGNYKPDIYPKSSPFQNVKSGEGFLLCTDGLLLNKYGDEQDRFYKYFVEAKTNEEFVDKLISNSYEMGSDDNITCISALSN